MYVSHAGASGVVASTAQGREALAERGLDRDAFLHLLVTQMRYQDPLGGGQDPSAFILQLSILTILEQVIRMAGALEAGQAAALETQSLGFLNKEVVIQDGYEEVSGLVNAVHRRNGAILLTVGGQDYPLSKVVTIRGGEAHGETDVDTY